MLELAEAQAMSAEAITIDAGALRTIVELVDEHAADWTRVTEGANQLRVELNTDAELEASGKPVAVYAVQHEGGAHRLDTP
jgi:hypothetical protein